MTRNHIPDWRSVIDNYLTDKAIKNERFFVAYWKGMNIFCKVSQRVFERFKMIPKD